MVVSTSADDPDAAALVREMTVEVSALYDEDPDLPSTLPAEVFSPPNGRFLVGYLDDRAVATAAYRRIDDELAEVHRVFVRREARGHGLSRQMMEQVEALTALDGYLRLRLETGTLQPAARRVYESMGWQPIADYYGHPQSRCYGKPLSATMP